MIREFFIASCALLALSCTTPATEVLVQIDTDAPLSRELSVIATVRAGDATTGPGGSATWTRGGPRGTATFPASFGITPSHTTTMHVTLVIDADLAPGVSGEPEVRFRRIARFEFIPNVTAALPIFLAVQCGNASTGCVQVSGGECTVSVRCEDQGETCGDLGTCAQTAVAVIPVDGGVPATDVVGMDGSHDASHPNDVSDATDGSDVRDASDAGSLGARCAVGGECASGNCADGVCCDRACGATCNACTAARKGGGADGICGNVAAGMDSRGACAVQSVASCGTTGACNGAGACAFHAAGTQCATPMCSTMTTLQTHTCNGAGSCTAPAPTTCGAYTCATGACRTTCAMDSQCAPPNSCIGTVCRTQFATGAACMVNIDCASSVCDHGACCPARCLTCQTCNGPTPGMCTNIVRSAGDGSACMTTRTCDGNGRCVGLPGTACATNSECLSNNCNSGTNRCI